MARTGNAERLRRYWSSPKAGIGWGASGDFKRCVRKVSKHMTRRQAKGYCAKLHKRNMGAWPGAGRRH